jgi:thiamine-phosphate pyrophosphorylase
MLMPLAHYLERLVNIALVNPIYLISDGYYLREQGLLLDTLSSVLCAANEQIAYVQLREQVVDTKQPSLIPATDREIIFLSEKILPLCHKYKCKLIINRRCDMALATGADGVHLGEKTISIDEARSLLGSSAIIGYSAHSLMESKFAEAEGADYITLSPIYPPISKQSKRSALGTEVLSDVCSELKIPVFALGGITKNNILECKQSGAYGVAVISSVLLAKDPPQACRELISEVLT